MSAKGTTFLGLSLLLVALLSVSLWQAFQLRSLRLDVSANRSAIEDLRAKVGSSAPKVKSRAWREKGRSGCSKGGAESSAFDERVNVGPVNGQPPPFVDITSAYGKAPSSSRNCEMACRELADCTLDGTACRGANTKNHDRILETCTAACASNLQLGIALSKRRECVDKIGHAKLRLGGFKSFCDGKDRKK